MVIMGAAGRDFHNFQVCYRDDPSVEVVAFTATQIPGIENRIFPPELAGSLYPSGIPIFPEEKLPEIIRTRKVQQVVFAYSDLAACGGYAPGFAGAILGGRLRPFGAGPDDAAGFGPGHLRMCRQDRVRQERGYANASGKFCRRARIRSVVIRHPMPYCDLNRMRVERFATMEDLDKYVCTVEEREEYEHLVKKGIIVYAGVDYGAIMEAAQREAQVILWDGGNNDFSFIKPDLEIVVMDPHRPGHERLYHPGEANFLRAQVLVINKMDTASKENVEQLVRSAATSNPQAVLIKTASRIYVDGGEKIRGKRVLVVEDGPTVTHGGMAYGAGALAARQYGAAELVDPRPYAVRLVKSLL